MSDIFLSYANADRERVRPLAQSLEARGWSVFWDRKIPVGKTWDQVIEREIDTVQAIVVLWSAASAQSDWVKTEAREGKARGILIPALIEQTRLPLEFRQLQTANLIDWTAGSAHPEFDEFVSGLASLLRKSPAPDAYPSEMRTPVEPAREAEQDDQRPQPEPPTAEADATQSETAQTFEGLEDRQTGKLLRGSEDSAKSTPTSNKRSLFWALAFLIIAGLLLFVAMRDTSEGTSTASGNSVAVPPPDRRADEDFTPSGVEQAAQRWWAERAAKEEAERIAAENRAKKKAEEDTRRQAAEEEAQRKGAAEGWCELGSILDEGGSTCRDE